MLAQIHVYPSDSIEVLKARYLVFANNLHELDVYERAILRHIASLLLPEQSLLGESVSCSFRMFAEALGMSAATARKKVQALIEKGYLLFEKVFLESYTGRMVRGPDRYRLTEKIFTPSEPKPKKKRGPKGEALGTVPEEISPSPSTLSSPLPEPESDPSSAAPTVQSEGVEEKVASRRAPTAAKWKNPFHATIDVSNTDEVIPEDRETLVRFIHEKLAMGLSERDQGRLQTILIMAEQSTFDMTLSYYKKYALGVKPVQDTS